MKTFVWCKYLFLLTISLLIQLNQRAYSQSGPSISLASSQSSFIGEANTDFIVNVVVGDTVPVADLVGISFHIVWTNPTIINGIGCRPGGFLGADPVFLSSGFNNRFEVGIASTSGGYSETGIVATCSLRVSRDVLVESEVEFALTNIKAVDGNGNDYVLSPIGLPLNIQLNAAGSTNAHAANSDTFLIYPTPFKRVIYVESPIKIKRIILTSLLGESKEYFNFSNDIDRIIIDTEAVKGGIYFLTIETSLNEKFTYRLLKLEN